MTVQELITTLESMDKDARVTIFDTEWGYIDIAEVFESEGKGFVRIA